jgi:hypothetical protein
MKNAIRSIAVAAGCLVAGTVAFAAFQQDPSEVGKQVADQVRAAAQDPAAMQKWEETMKLGPAHEFLQQAFTGEWDLEIKMWMDPQADPMTSKGTATIEPMFGGRFVRERVKADMMGQPWEGEGTTGYDNVKKQFISTWMDSMGTGIMMMRGSISPDGKTLTFIGEMDEPMTGEMGKAIRVAITVDSKDRHRMQMSEILYGDPFTVMELTYTRKGTNGGGDR